MYDHWREEAVLSAATEHLRECFTGKESLYEFYTHNEFFLSKPVIVVLRFTVMDNSDFSPNRLTVSIDSSYPFL